jgi:hypothetical protein
MYIEQTSTGRFALQDLTEAQLELIQNGLIEVKHHSLQDAELFKTERASCVDMFQKIDNELVKSRS